jgi:hypothetical protein
VDKYLSRTTCGWEVHRCITCVTPERPLHHPSDFPRSEVSLRAIRRMYDPFQRLFKVFTNKDTRRMQRGPTCSKIPNEAVLSKTKALLRHFGHQQTPPMSRT